MPRIIYLKSGKRRPVQLKNTIFGEDVQQQLPFDWCGGCGREIYELGQALCPECKGEDPYGSKERKSLPDLSAGQ